MRDGAGFNNIVIKLNQYLAGEAFKQNHSRMARPMRWRMPFERCSKGARSDPHLPVVSCIQEAPGFSKLGTSVEVCRLRKYDMSSVESNAVTSIETSVVEPGKTGKTAACRQSSARGPPLPVRGYTCRHVHDQQPVVKQDAPITYDPVCRIGLHVNLFPLAVRMASFIMSSSRRRGRSPLYLVTVDKRSRKRHINIP